MAIKTATDATFEVEVLQHDRPVIVDFWAAWCGPCKLVAPEMEKLAAKYEGSIDIVKVDVDANPGLSRAFNIMSIPTIAFFAPGKQPMGVVGFRPAEQLETQFSLASYPKIEAAAAADAGAVDAGAVDAGAASDAAPTGATESAGASVTDSATQSDAA
jgi:thioredoxin 1